MAPSEMPRGESRLDSPFLEAAEVPRIAGPVAFTRYLA